MLNLEFELLGCFSRFHTLPSVDASKVSSYFPSSRFLFIPHNLMFDPRAIFQMFVRDCYPKFVTELNMKIGIAQKVYKSLSCPFVKVIPS